MSEGILQEGGRHRIHRTGPHSYDLIINLPTDAMGMTGRRCPEGSCSPRVFNVKGGTGITVDQADAFCPYCRHAAEPNGFTTDEQKRYGEEILTREMEKGAARLLGERLGIGPDGKGTLGGGIIPIEMTIKTGPQPPIRRPWEEQLRRDVRCPHCTLEHAVYGLAVWCPDCGKDIFVTHVETECEVVRAMMNDVARRRAELGRRVAARDVENGLEDVVSIQEGAMKAITRRKLLADGRSSGDVEATMKKQVRNCFQGYDGSVRALNRLFGFNLTTALDPTVVDQFKRTLEKRHPIAHNLGVVDRKYLEKVQSSETEGRDVTLDESEVSRALDTVLTLVRYVHAGLFPTG